MKTCPNPQCQMTDIPDDFKFCPKCGTALEDVHKENSDNSQLTKDPKKYYPYLKWIIIVAVIVAGYFLHQHINNKNSYINTEPTRIECGYYMELPRFIDVHSNRDWNISRYPASWCHVSKSDGGKSVRLDADANSSTQPREDYFELTTDNGKTCRVDVVQKGRPDLQLSQNQITDNGKGGSYNIVVNTTEKWSIVDDVYKRPSWVSLTKNANGVSIEINPNTSDRDREMSFNIETNGRRAMVTVKQMGTYLRVNPSRLSSLTFEPEGGIQTIFIESNPQWILDGYPGWMTLVDKGGNLVVSVGANYGQERSGFIRIKAGNNYETVSVSQKGYR